MGNTVEQLNFKLIINDKEFDNKLRAIEKRAELFNTSVSKALDLTMSNSRVTKEMEQNYKRLLRMEQDTVKARENENREVSKTEALQKKLTAGLNESNTALSKHGKLWQQVTSLAAGYFSVAGAEKLLKNLVQVSAEFEFQKTTLRSILQDVQGADTIYEQIKTLAVKSPFNFKELVTYTKQLSAYQIPLNELYETTKMLADVSSGLGVGMDRLVLAYGQVRSAAFLRGQEVRQFTEAGIPILAELAKQFGEIEGRIVSTGEVFDKISKRQVPFEMVAKVFKQMTDEGGKFYKMQEVQAETLKGKISNLTDAYQIMFAEIGENSEGALKGAVDWIRSLAENYKQIGTEIAIMAATYGTARVALSLFTAESIKAAAANTLVAKSFKAIGAFIVNNPYALLATSVALLAGQIYKLTQIQDAYTKNRNTYEGNYAQTLAKDTAELDRIITKLKFAEKGTKEYAAARSELERNYSNYLAQLHQEGTDIDNLTALYDGLRQKIENTAKARIKFSAEKEIDETFGSEIDAVRRSAFRFADKLGLGAGDKQALWMLITGGYTKEQLTSTMNEYGGLVAKLNEKVQVGSVKGIPIMKEGWSVFNTIQMQAENAKDRFNEATTALDKFFGEVLKGEDVVDDVTNPEGSPEDNNLVKLLEAQIARLQKLKAAYTDISKYLSDEQISARWGDVFSTGFNFDEQIDTLIAKLRTLGTEGEEAAGKITDAMRMSELSDTTKQFADAATAAEKFRQEIEKWLAKDFGLEGTNIGYEISKIITQLNTATNTTKLTFDKLRQSIDAGKLDYISKAMASGANEGQAEALWEIYKARAFEVIEQIQAKQTSANKKDAQEKVNGLAQKAVKAGLESKFGTDKVLSHWTDKTLGQINDIKAGLQELLNGDVLSNIPQSIKDQAEAAGISLDDLIKKIKELLGLYNNNAGDEYKKKVSKIAKEITAAAGAFNGVFDTLGDKLNNEGLSSMGEMLKMASEFADIMIDAYAEFGKGNDAFSDTTDEMSQIMNSVSIITMAVKVVLSIFKQVANAINGLDSKTVFERLNDEIKALGKSIDSIFGQTSWEKISVALQGMQKAMDLSEGIRNLDEAAKTFRMTRDEFLAWQYELYQSGEENVLSPYFEQFEQFHDAVADLFSDLSSQITENMVEAFRKTGDAAYDLEDAFAEMGETLVKSMIQSYLLQGVLNKYEKDVEGIVSKYTLSQKTEKDWNTALNDFNAVFEKMGVELKDVAAFVAEGVEYARENWGSFQDESKSGDTLANGIKGITEDTANLLASYLNAIRADVSFNKITLGEMSADIKVLLGLVPQNMSLENYLNRIIANQGTIIARLEGALTQSELGGDGFKVVMS